MPINEVIRDKRKEIGLTQEQIAGFLGVSTPAVNKWEKGVACPDISLLPPLARLLKVDLNTLLCFNEKISKQEINRFSQEVIDTIRKSGYQIGFTIGIEKVQEYPNCSELIYCIAVLLDGALGMFGMDIEDKETYENQILELYERAAKGEDEESRNSASYMLVSKYIGDMEYDRAQEMLDALPKRASIDKNILQANLLIKQDKFDEASVILERKLLKEISEIQSVLMTLISLELKQGKEENAEYIAKVYEASAKLFDLWDYSIYVSQLQIAMAQKNVQASVAIMKSMLKSMLIPWNMSKSILYRHIPIREKAGNLGKQMLPAFLSGMENDPEFSFLQTNEEYQELIKEYRTKC